MKKIFIIPMLLLFILFNTTTVHSAPELSGKDLVNIYNEALDSLIRDPAMLSDKSYIAIDMSIEPLKNISASEKLQILNYMKKYDMYRINVIAASMDDLKAKGLTDNNNNLNLNGIRGIFLKITNVQIVSNNEIIVEGSWYTGEASKETIRTTLINDNGRWKVKNRTII